MPNEYSLNDLVKLTGVSPRTVRYYIAQGLLPSPSQAGPAARYTDVHLDRLRVIRRLQATHLPLAEIRNRLKALPDDQLAAIAEGMPSEQPPDSALDYIRVVLGGRPRSTVRAASVAAPTAGTTAAATPPPPIPPMPSLPASATPWEPPLTSYRRALPSEPPTEPQPQPATPPVTPPVTPPATQPAARPPTQQTAEPERAQWERISLDPDIELHVRRPLTRQLNKRVERLISIARQLLEEE